MLSLLLLYRSTENVDLARTYQTELMPQKRYQVSTCREVGSVLFTKSYA